MSLKIYLDDCAFSYRLRQLLRDAGYTVQIPAEVIPPLTGQLKLPRDFNGGPTVHAANERVPVDAIAFGCEAVYQVLRRYQAPG